MGKALLSAEEAKPKVPHPEGRRCLCCEATQASQWRGPGMNYCSIGKCRREAKEARKKMCNTAAPEDKVKVLEAAVRELEEQLGALDTNVEHQDKRIAEQEGRLGQQEEAMAAMKRQMAFLAQQMMQPRGSKQAGEKRPALAELPPRVQLPQ